MKQQVLRKVLTGNWEAFNLQGYSYFIKNFTDAAIYVSFEDESENPNWEAESVKINKNVGEEIFINGSIRRSEYKANAIYVKGTGEVEVQVTSF